MAFLLERDSINGKDGKAFMVKDGKPIQLFNVKNLNGEANIDETPFKVVGTRIIQKKTGGLTYQGTMTLYYGSRYFLDMVLDYQGDLSRIPYFDLQVVNDDKSSTVGKRNVLLKNCKLSGTIPVTRLDSDSDILEESVNFSYSYIERLREFNEPASLGGQ